MAMHLIIIMQSNYSTTKIYTFTTCIVPEVPQYLLLGAVLDLLLCYGLKEMQVSRNRLTTEPRAEAV